MSGKVNRKNGLISNFMMAVAIIAACVLMPLGFILSGPFAVWLKSTGVHANPNFADGTLVAGFDRFESPSAGMADGRVEGADPALSIHRFAVKKVAFRPFSGIGIEPRLNLCFEFDGRLGDSRSDSRELGMTVIHVYLKTPGRPAGIAESPRAANVDFEGTGWDFEVIVDGYHEQARIFDRRGEFVGQGLGIYVRREDQPVEGSRSGAATKSSRTMVTAGLPMELLGDPSAGEWQAYVLVGIADLRHPSMMLHSGRDGSLTVFRAALAEGYSSTRGGKPRLRALSVRNPV